MNVQFPPSAIVPALTQASAPSVSANGQESFHQALSQATADDKKLADTAKQFEAVMIGQVLKAARSSSDGGWLGSGGDDDQTGEMAVELAEQGLAQGLAANGSLGIAKMVLKNLRHHDATGSSSAPAGNQ